MTKGTSPMNKIKELIAFALIVIGALLASFAVACILLPNDALDYGTAGVSMIISRLTGASLPVCVILVIAPFLVAGAVVLGRLFFFKALVGTVVYTIGLAFFEKIPFTLNTEHFIAVIFGGAILGLGLSLVMRNGGCIDGSEMLASIIVKKLAEKTGKHYSMTVILIIFNAGVYAAIFFLIDRDAAMLSLLVYIVATAIIDRFTDRFEAVKQVTMITQTPDVLVDVIRHDLKTTCTIIDSRGAIAGENTTLICYVNYYELQNLRSILSRHKGTFCTVSSIEEILK